ncbi:MAG: (2Fe-2S)-binding protein [Alphaproteobacteria bacterium]|nr:(2Fe-2S)-binding protein [Alphaproteobacteria bacterium]
MPVSCVLNGVATPIAGDPNRPLLYALREECGLTSPHFGCGLNQCGACYVLIDGHAVASCDTPVWSAEGKSITTVEGLGTADKPHALQRALIEEQAAQCGYCLSGIMISAAALLKKNPSPSEHEVKAALDGNLCRCGAHNRIVRGVLRAAQDMKAGGAA